MKLKVLKQRVYQAVQGGDGLLLELSLDIGEDILDVHGLGGALDRRPAVHPVSGLDNVNPWVLGVLFDPQVGPMAGTTTPGQSGPGSNGN